MYWCVNLLIVLLVSLISLHMGMAQVGEEAGSVENSLEEIDGNLEQPDDGVEVEAIYDQLGEGEAGQSSSALPRKRIRAGSFGSFEKISELSTLAPFRDVAVISRKFLPKSRRFEFSSGALLILNNAFFNNMGFALRGGFFFSEKWGIEGQYHSLYSSERSVTQDLENFRSISTRSLVVPKSFIGGAIKWAPIYGKMSWFEGRIISFDLFFNLGYGVTETLEGDAGTWQLGVGQNFALNKSMALRWDVAWNRYSAQVRIGGIRNEIVTLSHSDLYCGIGLSFFIPGVKYR